MSQRLQIRVPDELAVAVREAARAEKRSMTSWIALRLEEALRAPMGGSGATYVDFGGGPAFTINDQGGSTASTEAHVDLLSAEVAKRKRQGLEELAAKICAHKNIERRPGASGGLVRSCRDCGKVML